MYEKEGQRKWLYEQLEALPEDELRKVLKADSALWEWYDERTKVRIASRLSDAPPADRAR
jgi:hypothetical protein